MTWAYIAGGVLAYGCVLAVILAIFRINKSSDAPEIIEMDAEPIGDLVDIRRVLNEADQ